jgi:hypothetical protein
VIYAQSVAAHNAGFKADPDGDSADAETLGARQIARANLALAKITSIPPTTAEGLQSKARIVPMMIDDSLGSRIEDNEIAFLVSFAAEVKKFLEPIINEHWSADLAARKGKTAAR